MGIENDTLHINVNAHGQYGYRKRYPHINMNAHGQHGYRKRYPAHQGNSPQPSRVSKTIPSTPRKLPTALTGIENDTHPKWCQPTPYKNAHPCPHGYEKSYPPHQYERPQSTWVSKTIPSIPGKLPIALTGIENNTLRKRCGI